MSKRYCLPQQHGERKKAKLDVSISDHNFPLNQSSGPSKEADQADTWGDDNDDEILLMASQACDQAYNDTSILPDYSVCMQPSSTSTQMFDPCSSTSQSPNPFKKPKLLPGNVISTHLKDKCGRISSPLPGMSSKMIPKQNGHVNSTDEFILNDKIHNGLSSDDIYGQYLDMKLQNEQLIKENCKLLEKFITKEGEASILRTQLKTCQVAVDNARLERMKAQEKVQQEWTEKLTTANSQINDLRIKLDFKNLEIISIKEKCKMLDSNKVKLTQVTVGANDISASHRNSSICGGNDSYTQHAKRVQMTSNAVQTEDKARFLRLNKTCASEASNLVQMLPLILEPTEEQHTLLEYNEKLQRDANVFGTKCRFLSKFHMVPSVPVASKDLGTKMSLTSVHEDLTYIAAGGGADMLDRCFNVVKAVKLSLLEVHREVEAVSHKMSAAFRREADERYMEASTHLTIVDRRGLLGGRSLFKEEQGILARRMVAILACILESSNKELLQMFEDQSRSSAEQNNFQVLELMQDICNLLDSTSCAILYSGLLLTIISIIEHLLKTTTKFNTSITETIRSVIACRPMPVVCCRLMTSLRLLSQEHNFLATLCPGHSMGNIKVDYDQGVFMYKKDSCLLQVFLKQLEVSLKCIEKQNLWRAAVEVTHHLVALLSNVNSVATSIDKTRCDCQLVLLQVVVFALRICAVMFVNSQGCHSGNEELVAVCRLGVQAVYQSVQRDLEISSKLAHEEGHLLEFCELLRGAHHSELYATMLSELSGTFQSCPEDAAPSSSATDIWINSFQTFSLTE